MKKKTRSSLVKLADKHFSIYIRQRGTIDGFNYCVTCKKRQPWQELQTGHFQSRRHYSTRWDPMNCAPQCVGCNMFKQGEQYLFGLAIDANWGAGTADSLILKAKQTVKLSTADLEAIVERYKTSS